MITHKCSFLEYAGSRSLVAPCAPARARAPPSRGVCKVDHNMAGRLRILHAGLSSYSVSDY